MGNTFIILNIFNLLKINFKNTLKDYLLKNNISLLIKELLYLKKCLFLRFLRLVFTIQALFHFKNYLQLFPDHIFQLFVLFNIFSYQNYF